MFVDRQPNNPEFRQFIKKKKIASFILSCKKNASLGLVQILQILLIEHIKMHISSIKDGKGAHFVYWTPKKRKFIVIGFRKIAGRRRG